MYISIPFAQSKSSGFLGSLCHTNCMPLDTCYKGLKVIIRVKCSDPWVALSSSESHCLLSRVFGRAGCKCKFSAIIFMCDLQSSHFYWCFIQTVLSMKSRSMFLLFLQPFTRHKTQHMCLGNTCGWITENRFAPNTLYRRQHCVVLKNHWAFEPDLSLNYCWVINWLYNPGHVLNFSNSQFPQSVKWG